MAETLLKTKLHEFIHSLNQLVMSLLLLLVCYTTLAVIAALLSESWPLK